MQYNNNPGTYSDAAIIVVDDVELTTRMLCSALQQVGFTDVRSALSADQVLDLIRDRPADVVLADWIMPDIDGLALTTRIRDLDEKIKHYTSVILFTAREGKENLALAFNHGIDDYLNKPIDDIELAARVHAAARTANLQNVLLDTTTTLTDNNRLLEELALTDPLTGLGNRRYLMSHLGPILIETSKRGGLVSVAMIDIDNFKDINDRHGHDVGDDVIKGIASRLSQSIRPTDILTRHGGEEFVLVMHYNDADRYRDSIYSRILNAINQRPVKTGSGDITVTISIGVVNHTDNDPDTTVDAILKRADEKLYTAKNRGRNCVET